MTKFDCYVERLSAKRRAAREERLNDELLRSLKTRTKQDTVVALYENLTFIVGTSDLIATDRVKTLVF